MELVLCTGNDGKVAELLALLPMGMKLTGLRALGLPTDLPETGDNLEANALQKARFVFQRVGIPCIADDTGLEVDALNGAPGVHSARYAGEAKDATANMAKLLHALQGTTVRTARFRTVLALIDAQGDHTFEGVVEGRIAERLMGTQGFGYDPIFIPHGQELTFAQMDKAAKNTMSHRARAVKELIASLAQRYR